jgi:ATP synthase F subunit
LSSYVKVEIEMLKNGYGICSLRCSICVCQVANMIRFLVDGYNKPVPAILEIPSKDHPYDPAHDSVLSRVKYLFSAESVASDRR